MKEIKAYKTIDGKIFESKKDASKHERIESVNINRDRIFKANLYNIKKHISETFGDSYFRGIKPKIDNINIYHEGKYGWKCEFDGEYRNISIEEEEKEKAIIEKNPIDVCIYSDDLYFGSDCCVYCNEPEERK